MEGHDNASVEGQPAANLSPWAVTPPTLPDHTPDPSPPPDTLSSDSASDSSHASSYEDL